MQRPSPLVRVFMTRTRPAVGPLIGLAAILFMLVIQTAILDLLAGKISGGAELGAVLTVLFCVARIVRGRLD